MPTKAQLADPKWLGEAMNRERKHIEVTERADAGRHAKKILLGTHTVPGIPLHKALDHAVRRAGRSAKAAARLAADLDRALDDLRQAQSEAKSRR
jgi:hypothetical protein